MSFERRSPGAPACAPTKQRTRRSVDQIADAAIGRFTGGLSPTALALAYIDWSSHLAKSFETNLSLALDAQQGFLRFAEYCLRACVDPGCRLCVHPEHSDKRFADEQWKAQPFQAYAQAFLLVQNWWREATTGAPGVTPHHQMVVSFAARQWLDVFSPANFAMTNPEVLNRTIGEAGANLHRGFGHWLDDVTRLVDGRKPVGAEDFAVGRDVATTPGRVVFRNELMELIQYDPRTPTTHPEPVLIVPAWIMKYYILDLSPGNSLVRYLVESGFTVFIISWKNPSREDRDLSLEDYRRLGVETARNECLARTRSKSLHLVGYCLGGTLAAIEAAALARDGDKILRSLTLLAAQVDFSEAGELTLFVDESQVAFLENVMEEKGYLDAKQMAGAFQFLRSSDLIWSSAVRNYLLGERPSVFDLMAWNADATRMPSRMHGEYLRRLFLDNELARNLYCVDGRPVALRDIRTPIFSVGTESDHVAPWRSVYKVHTHTNSDVTFVLSTGGHNAGVVNPPNATTKRHQIARHDDLKAYIDPDSWRAGAQNHEGSWWPCWLDWLKDRSSAPTVPPAIISEFEKAPGTYVFQP